MSGPALLAVRLPLIAAAMSAATMCGAPADAWTLPVSISQPGDTGCSVPRIASASDGKMLVAYRRKTPDWRLLYRERSGAGTWGPVEVVSAPWTERPEICEDPQRRPHMFFAGTGVNPDCVDLYEAVRQSGKWTVTRLVSESGRNTDYPRAGVDGLGRLHLVYTKSSRNGQADVYYRLWSGSWSAETYIGHVTNPYYDRPDLAVDASNNVHVVYCTNTRLLYRKLRSGVWGPELTLGTTTEFFAYPRVAAPTPDTVVVVIFDQHSEPRLYYTASDNGGASWTAPFQYLVSGHYPAICVDNSGNALLVFQKAGGKPLQVRRWNASSGWSASENATPGAHWEGWPSMAADASGTAHLVYDDSDPIGYTNSMPDTIPPGQVTSFTGAPSDGAVLLSWKNPSDPDFRGVLIRTSTSGYPATPSSGTSVVEKEAAAGSSDFFVHPGLTNNLTYYYSAFSLDTAGNYSAPAKVSARPATLSCGAAKLLGDGSYVSLQDKIVTAVFAEDGCMYVEDADRSGGVRVLSATTSTGVPVAGDRVSIAGTIGTRILSGYASERQITPTIVVSRGAGTPLEPLGMHSRALGGEPLGTLAPGVVDGIGLNSIGLLIRLTGRVTARITQYIYVEDGGQIHDIQSRTGVMVRCPTTTIPVSVGDAVSVAGVLEGSIPNGWTENRRLIRIRNYSDLVVLFPAFGD